MLRYRLNHYKSPLSSTTPIPATSRSNMDDPPLSKSDHKSLTPQRKHHKLLKDGSEVWSKEVEEIFVDGLRKYWESPWATYSRGRSRWRNQFLVDHLKKNGVERSKKQVASHIQVLRNMWRGEPEFHLVAGGEELFQENGLLASPKSNSSMDSSEPQGSVQPEAGDWRSSWSSSASSTPDFAALQYTTLDAGPSISHPMSVPNPRVLDRPEASSRPSSSVQSDARPPGAAPAHTRTGSGVSVKLEPLSMGSPLFTLPHASAPDPAEFPFFAPPLAPPNRLCAVNLWMDSTPLSAIDVDQLISASTTSMPSPPFRILLRLRINLPPSYGVPPPPSQMGIQGAVTFASQWATSAKCYTKTWAGKQCVAHEMQEMQQFNAQQVHGAMSKDSSMIVAYLPDSALSRCTGLDSTVQTITQQIIVDKEVLAVIIYILDRSFHAGTSPTVDLVGFHKYPWHTSSPSPPISPATLPNFPSTYGAPLMAHAPLFSRPPSGVDDFPPLIGVDFSQGLP